MSDEGENKPTLGRKPLGLKPRIESGEVKQTFSHGRTNKVVVEVKRKKLVGKPGAPVEVAAPPPPPPPPPPPVAVAKPKPVSEADAMLTRQELQTKLLREAEEARLAQLEENRRREEEAKARQSEEERRRAEENRKADVETPKTESSAPVVEADAYDSDDQSAVAAPPAPRRFHPC
jgi:translation initiation factor IF-2